MTCAVLFDLDGVLVDAKEWHYKALNDALREIGEQYVINRAEHLNTYDGLSTKQKLELLTENKGLPKKVWNKVYESKQERTSSLIQSRCSPKDNITETIKFLRAHPHVSYLGVCSNAIRPSVEHMLKKMGVYEMFDLILSNQDVSSKKPSPEIYQKACEKLEVSPNECLVLEDNHNGVAAAQSAGCNLMVIENPSCVTPEALSERLRIGKNNKEIDLVIPAAGRGSRFAQAGYELPKPLIDVSGAPMVERALENLSSKKYHVNPYVLMLEEHIQQNRELLDRLEARYHVTFIPVDQVTEGAACTILFARRHFSHRPLVVANSDQLVDVDFDDFLDDATTRRLDGNIMVFEEPERNPKWSYAHVNQQGLVDEVREKDPFSPYATVGIYYFGSGKDFVDSALEMIVRNVRTKGEFYLCPVYNFHVQKHRKVGLYSINKKAMHGLGTPEDLEAYLKK